ncbi:hypothetical protein M3J09_004696 [Ascochyta lentis]
MFSSALRCPSMLCQISGNSHSVPLECCRDRKQARKELWGLWEVLIASLQPSIPAQRGQLTQYDDSGLPSRTRSYRERKKRVTKVLRLNVQKSKA